MRSILRSVIRSNGRAAQPAPDDSNQHRTPEIANYNRSSLGVEWFKDSITILSLAIRFNHERKFDCVPPQGRRHTPQVSACLVLAAVSDDLNIMSARSKTVYAD